MSGGYSEVLPFDADRAEWLEARRTGLGSSDIAGILNQSSWATPYSVWWSKVGSAEERDRDARTTELLRWGNLLEPVIAQAWSEDVGIGTSRIGLCRSTERAWQMATPDRLTDDGGVLECKTASGWDSEWDTDTVPLKYLLQVTQQMDVLGVSHGYMAVLIGGNEFRCYEVPLDSEIVSVIREAGEEFWKLVETQTAPPTDAHPATTAALKSRFVTVDGSTATLDWQWHQRILEREHLKAELVRMEKAAVEIDNELRAAIGSASTAVCGGQVIATWNANKKGVRTLRVVDTAKRRDISA